MTRFIHDQFAKDYLEELLKPYGKVEAPSHVPGEVREIDVLFTPFLEQKADIASLGLLGKLATTLAIFEPFRNPASTEEIRTYAKYLSNPHFSVTSVPGVVRYSMNLA